MRINYNDANEELKLNENQNLCEHDLCYLEWAEGIDYYEAYRQQSLCLWNGTHLRIYWHVLNLKKYIMSPYWVVP